MTMQNPLAAIHGKAIDLASEDDRLWFEQNPERLHRLRDVLSFENNGPLELPPYGTTWKMLVTQSEPGVRLRMLIALPDDVQGDSDDDTHLGKLFAKVAPPAVKKLIKKARKRKLRN